MFKRADKSELRLWLIGTLFLLLCAGIVAVALIAGIIINGFKTSRLVWGIVFGLITFLFCLMFVKIIKALASFDDRQNKKIENENKKKEAEKEAKRAELEKEAKEMEELRKQEEQKREEMRIQLEEMQKEKELKEKEEKNKNK